VVHHPVVEVLATNQSIKTSRNQEIRKEKDKEKDKDKEGNKERN
jgi:hypothetical protein